MTREAELADRAVSIRAAARSWKKAGAIGDAELAGIEAAYPDDRQRAGPVFRVLLFIFTLIAINGAFGFVALLLGPDVDAMISVLSFVFGLVMAFLTEIQVTGMRRAQGGTEAATSLSAVSGLIVAAGWVLFEKSGLTDGSALTILLLVSALLLVAAAWRWGYPIYAAASAVALLGLLARMPLGRLLWILVPLLAAPLLVRLAETRRLPPSHRSSCRAVLFLLLAGLYAAVHLGSFDARIVEEMGGFGRVAYPQEEFLRLLSAIATALVPVAFLAIGVRSRRYPFLLLGAVTVAASLVTLRYYVHLAPLWVVLTVCGAALAGLVLAVRRYLDAGPDRERHGFTAEPLFEEMERRRMLEAGAAVVSFSPGARPTHEEPRFAGEGGQFGGGGSNSEF